MKRPHIQKHFSVPSIKVPNILGNIYKGNTEIKMWHPTGLLIDNSVIGAVINIDNGGILGPLVYPIHIAREPIPSNYIMAPPCRRNNCHRVPKEFEEYMWMEKEKEFEEEVFKKLDEEALMAECVETMFAEEEYEKLIAFEKANAIFYEEFSIHEFFEHLRLKEYASKSKLNPFAKEFVPSYARLPPKTPPENPPKHPPGNPPENSPENPVGNSPEGIQEVEAPTTVDETADKAITQKKFKYNSGDKDKKEFPKDSREVGAANATGINHNKKHKNAKKAPKPKPEAKKHGKYDRKPKKKVQPKKKEGKAANNEINEETGQRR